MATATLSWNANTETDLAGYKVYRGLGTAALSLLLTVGKVTGYTDSTLPDVTQSVSYALSAFDSKGNEGQRCPTQSIMIDVTAPAPPTGFSVTVTVTVTPP